MLAQVDEDSSSAGPLAGVSHGSDDEGEGGRWSSSDSASAGHEGSSGDEGRGRSRVKQERGSGSKGKKEKGGGKKKSRTDEKSRSPRRRSGSCGVCQTALLVNFLMYVHDSIHVSIVVLFRIVVFLSKSSCRIINDDYHVIAIIYRLAPSLPTLLALRGF